MRAALLLTGTLAGAAQTTIPARRACRPGPPVLPDGQKKVLIIGDSISLGATPHVAQKLAGVAGVAHGPYSGDGGALDSKYAIDTDVEMTGASVGPPWRPEFRGFTRYGDGCLNGTFLTTSTQGEVAYDVISFNYGVHDIDYADNGFNNKGYHEEWVPLNLYTENLRTIKQTLQATGAAVVFESSTPVCYNLTRNQRILDYNAAAKRVMAEHPPIMYNDLYAAVVGVCGNPPYNAPDIPGSPNCSYANYGNVHYQAKGWDLLANVTTAALLKLLNTPRVAPRAAPVGKGAPIVCNATELFADAAARDPNTAGHSFDAQPWSVEAAGGSATPTSCPANSTCMVTAFSTTGMGCCLGMGTNAVACADNVHCCPEHWTCSKDCRLGGCQCLPPQ